MPMNSGFWVILTSTVSPRDGKPADQTPISPDILGGTNSFQPTRRCSVYMYVSNHCGIKNPHQCAFAPLTYSIRSSQATATVLMLSSECLHR